jgi:ribosomal-protein-alanine acetyltransferase
MKIEIRLMQGEDLPQIVAIEQSWTYLSKWGQEGYLAVLRDPRVYACLVAEDVEAEMSVVLRREAGIGLREGPSDLHPSRTPLPLPGRGMAPSHQSSHSQGNITDTPEKPSIVGFAVLALLIDHCELCNLVVRPAYISKKIGYLLLQQCFEVAQHCRIERIFLEVRQSNHRAIAFYERNGFRTTSQRKNYYRSPPEHAWIMERRLHQYERLK